MPEAVRYPAKLQVADEGTFDGFHDPFRIPDPVLGKYLDEVLVEGGKNTVSEEVETLFQAFVESVFGNFSFYSYKKACGQKKTVRGSKNSRRLSNGTPAI